METMDVLRFVTFASMIVLATASCYVDDVTHSGEATFYDWATEAAAGQGACGYDVSAADIEVAAIGSDNWAGSKSCGMCVEVTGPTGDTLEVIVIDQCPTCSADSLDLSQAGFNAISGGGKGLVHVTWREIECPVIGSAAGFVYIFVYANEDSSTPFNMRIFNHRHKVSKVERKQPSEGDDADWFDLPRGNVGSYGVPKGHRKVTKPFQVRLTSDITGEVTTETINENPKNGVREFIVGTNQFASLCSSDDGGDGTGGDGTGGDGDGSESGNTNLTSSYFLISFLLIVLM